MTGAREAESRHHVDNVPEERQVQDSRPQGQGQTRREDQRNKETWKVSLSLLTVPVLSCLTQLPLCCMELIIYRYSVVWHGDRLDVS